MTVSIEQLHELQAKLDDHERRLSSAELLAATCRAQAEEIDRLKSELGLASRAFGRLADGLKGSGMDKLESLAIGGDLCTSLALAEQDDGKIANSMAKPMAGE